MDIERSQPTSVEVVLDAMPRSIGAARRLVSGLMGRARVPDEVVEDVLLLVSELVTNAVLHAGGPVRLSAAVEPGRILVAVGDDDPHHAPSRDDRGAMATSGRGMHLVDLLASSWGVDVGQSSKVVWFEASYPLGSRDLRSIPG